MCSMGVPPTSTNRGVERTIKNGLIAGVDWFQGTWKGGTSFETFCAEILDLNPALFTKTDKGLYGWGGQAFFGSIRVLYGGRAGSEGVHLLMSGQACREYEQMRNLEDMMRRFIEKGSLSRLDIAVDDIRGYFSIQTMARYLREGKYSMRFRKYRIMETWGTAENEAQGITIYFGSPKSNMQIRFYEKDKERVAKGYELVEGIKIWNRGEIQLRDEHANNALREIFSKGIGKVFFDLVYTNIRFLKESNDTNKRRWETVKWWKDYLGDCERLSIAPKMLESDLITADMWIDRQVTKTLAKIWLAQGGRMDRIIEYLEEGAEKLTEEDFEEIEKQSKRYNQYLRKKALEETFRPLLSNTY